MKRILFGVVAATPCLFATWCSAICLARFLTAISASAAAPPPSAEELNAAEKWVVERVTAGKEADLSRQFPEEKDRKLSAHFLENLLMGTLSGVTLHRHGVQIKGACIDEPIDLENARIPCEVRLDNCIFKGPVDFRGADIASNFSVGWAKFQDKARGAIFGKMKVGGDAYFGHAVFEGPADFFGADIERGFSVQGAKFQNKEKPAVFWKMKVGSDAFFDASFEGAVIFIGADITGNFQAGAAAGAKFQNEKGEAAFSKMKVGGDFFISAVFEGPVSFTGTDIAGNFNVGAKFRDKKRGASFSRVKVGGTASFNRASFEGPVDLRYAEFGSLDVSGALWPKDDPAQFRLQGVNYKIILAEEPKSHEKLLDLINHAAYSADVYSRLEEFFLHQGYRADADEAFTAGKVRERQEYFRRGDWFGWLRSWMLDLLVGYGRQPWRAGVSCAVLVALGCVLFSPKKMEPQSPEDTPRVYNRFWYSLGLFLPFVDLQSNKVWKPKADQTFLRNYMRVHILLGWILVPLVLAAVTGLIK